jgi:subtilisin family serine protease
MVQADQLWDEDVRGSGVTVCVIDTGIDKEHEDFVKERLSGLDSDSSPPLPWGSDRHDHGTHCSGTIAAPARNGRGVIGVAPDAEIYTVRVFNDNNVRWAYASDALDAVYRCQAAGAKIVSMSLGYGGYTNVLNDAYTQLLTEYSLLRQELGLMATPDSITPRVSMASFPLLLLTAIRKWHIFCRRTTRLTWPLLGWTC